MVIPRDAWAPADPDVEWTALCAEAKHERILRAAGRVFGAAGLGAPMPAVAAEAGAGVASVYRQFPSKRDLLAALVTRRLEQIGEAASQAASRSGDRWTALAEMLRQVVEGQAGDDFLGEAWRQVSDHPEVIAATGATDALLERLLAEARSEGRLRADATVVDVRLLLTATRAARQLERGAHVRMLVLLLDGLEARSA